MKQGQARFFKAVGLLTTLIAVFIYFSSNSSKEFLSERKSIEPPSLEVGASSLSAKGPNQSQHNYNTSTKNMPFKFEHKHHFEMSVRKTQCEPKVHKRRFPSGIIIGEKKCGTGALQVLLALHPRLSVPHRESHYFDRRYKRESRADYINSMAMSCPGDVTIEKTPTYFATEGAGERIYRARKNILSVLIVRDPLRRLISEYAQDVRVRNRSITLEDSVFKLVDGVKQVNTTSVYVKTSLYANNLKRWLELFPRENILIVDGDKFVYENPAPYLRTVSSFLGVEPYFSENMFKLDEEKGYFCLQSGCLPEAKGHSFPEMFSEEDLQLLRRFFEPFNKEFYRLAGEDFGWPSG